MKKSEIKDISEKMININKQKLKLKETTKKKLDLLESYEETKKEHGENSGISMVIHKNIENIEKEEEKLKQEDEENTKYIKDIYNKNKQLKEELKKLEEKVKTLQADKEYINSVIKRDEENNVSQTDKIQLARKDKSEKLNKKIESIDKEISEKRNITNELDEILKIFDYIENSKEKDLEDEENDSVEKDSQNDDIIENISEGIEKKLQEMDLDKDNNVIDKKIITDRVKKIGNDLIKEMGQEYKNVHIYNISKKEPNIDDREPEILYKEGEELPKEQVEGLENKKQTEPNNVVDEPKVEKDSKFRQIIEKIKSSKVYKIITGFFNKIRNNVKLLPQRTTNKSNYVDSDEELEHVTINVKEIIEKRRKKDEMEKCGFVEKVSNKDGHIEKTAKKNIERVEGEIVPKEEYNDLNSTNKREVVDGKYINVGETR